MSEIAKELGEVVAALEKATPGPWQSKDPYLWDEIIGDIDGPDDMQYHCTDVAQAFGRADATAIVAAVNFLRTHHAALAAMVADAERYRWLRDNCVREWESDMDHDRGARSLDIDFDAPGWDLDSAIDTARQAAGEVVG